MEQQKFEDDTGDLELTEDYIVIDDVATGSGSTYLDLSNLRKRKTKIISSAKETIENGECPVFFFGKSTAEIMAFHLRWKTRQTSRLLYHNINSWGKQIA